MNIANWPVTANQRLVVNRPHRVGRAKGRANFPSVARVRAVLAEATKAGHSTSSSPPCRDGSRRDLS